MSFLRRFSCILLLAASCCFIAAAQRRPRLAPSYDKWLNEEAVYIISDEERKDFLKLPTDADRDKFIDDFWDLRNPLRGSKQNPFKEEHYRRLEYANQNFGRMSNTPGWKTDMGRTYILFGKPTSRAPFVGYGQIYPLELWFYQNNTSSPSLPPFFYVLFFIPEDIGEYRFYHPITDGPLKLVRGSQFRTNRDVYNFLKPLGGDLARSVLSLIPSEPVDTQDFEPSMTAEMLVGKIQNLANDSFQLQRIREMKYLREKVKSWFTVIQDKPLDISHIVLSDPTGQYWLDYSVWIDDEKLGRPAGDGKQLTISTGYRLLTPSDELVVEDAEERAFTAYDDSSGQKKFRPFLLANRIPVVPGKYKLEVRIDNRDVNRTYKSERTVDVGDAAHPVISGPLVAAFVQPVSRPDPATPFQYFGAQFLPAAERRVSKGNPLRLLFQIHRPAADARTYQLEYVVAQLQDRSQRRSLTDTVAPSEFQNGALLKSKTIPLLGLDPGDYRLVLTLRGEGSAEVLTSASLPLKIEEERPLPALFFLSNARALPANGVAAYVRALESLALKNNDKAAEYFRQSLDQNPSNAFAVRSLVGIYFTAGKFDRINELYSRFGMAAFNGAPETLAQAALSFWRTGKRENAQRVLQDAQRYFPKDALLLAAAKKISEPAPR